MATDSLIREVRLKKLEKIKDFGMDPYPAKVPRDFCLFDASNNFEEYLKSEKSVSLAGRIMAIRGQGAIQFIVLEDGRGRFQAVIKKDVLEEKLFSLFQEAVDIGDIISVTGNFFLTQKGEKSLMVKSWTMASKSLLPLPEKWHGLQDIEEKLRLRYLDMLMDPDLREMFRLKSKFWQVTRNFLNENGFLEVETPTLEVTTGGAEATPFKTHHNDFDLDVYMRISVGELWQKRLMAANFPKTFEIGRVYRNEGTSPEHLQEFTNMEFYWSYADYRDGMELVRNMYIKIAKEVFGKTEFTTRGHTFDLANEWVLIDFGEEIKKQTGLDIESASETDLQNKLKNLKVSFEGNNRERMIDSLWKYCRKNISGPAFLVHHPILVAPLAKSLPQKDDKLKRDSLRVQMFQPIIAGSEVGRGYSELNDPLDQRARFEEQAKLLAGGDTEAMMPDFEFVEMLEHGMPPTCGFGFGERFFAFLVDKPLRETQIFPLMRPK